MRLSGSRELLVSWGEEKVRVVQPVLQKGASVRDSGACAQATPRVHPTALVVPS